MLWNNISFFNTKEEIQINKEWLYVHTVHGLKDHIYRIGYSDVLTTTTITYYTRYEPQHYKTNKMACAPSKDSDQPGHPPSLISLCCPHEETLGPYLPVERTAKTLIRLWVCPGWSKSSLGTQSFCWFCHAVAHMYIDRTNNDFKQQIIYK